jgi:hypothetical protein
MAASIRNESNFLSSGRQGLELIRGDFLLEKFVMLIDHPPENSVEPRVD